MKRRTTSKISSDVPYNPRDPEAVAAFWEGANIVHKGKVIGKARNPGQRGPQKAPTKQQVTLRLSRDVISHFKSGGRGWQTRLDVALRKLVKTA